jgi:hypothetical protein
MILKTKPWQLLDDRFQPISDFSRIQRDWIPLSPMKSRLKRMLVVIVNARVLESFFATIRMHFRSSGKPAVTRSYIM